MTPEEVKNELATGKCYWNGRDKDGTTAFLFVVTLHLGHIIAVIRPHLHITAKRDYDECLKFVYYSAESGVAQMGETNDRYVVLYDARNIGMQNLDLAFVCTSFYHYACVGEGIFQICQLLSRALAKYAHLQTQSDLFLLVTIGKAIYWSSYR